MHASGTAHLHVPHGSLITGLHLNTAVGVLTLTVMFICRFLFNFEYSYVSTGRSTCVKRVYVNVYKNPRFWCRHPPGAIIGTVGGQAVEETYAEALDTLFG